MKTIKVKNKNIIDAIDAFKTNMDNATTAIHIASHSYKENQKALFKMINDEFPETKGCELQYAHKENLIRLLYQKSED